MKSNTERTKIAFGLVAIVLIMVVSYIVYPSQRPDSVPQENGETIPNIEQDVDFIDFSESQPQVITEEGDSYVIQASYPKLSGEGGGVSKANQVIVLHIEKIVEEFKQAAKENEITGNIKHVLYIGYHFNLLSKDVFSLRFSVSEYFSGAAHPGNYVSVMNYDITNEKQIELKDVFLPEFEYLTFISALTTTKLLEQFGDDASIVDWARTGAAPTEENYKNFGFSKENLIIYFNPYQVGPYAAGIQEIEIPYQEIKEKLRPDSFILRLQL